MIMLVFEYRDASGYDKDLMLKIIGYKNYAKVLSLKKN